jgi:hypothetical protein
MNRRNLDRCCAQYGWQMASEAKGKLDQDKKSRNAETLITKSLGVLQEDGVYAFFLYLVSRGKKEREGADVIKGLAAGLLKEAQIPAFQSYLDPLEAVRGGNDGKSRGLADDLDHLLLAKRLLEQALIYARYHAKALGGRS